jgi:glucokinase
VILAGDVGGTKTALALFEGGASGLVAVREAALPSRQFRTFEETLAAFLGDGPPAHLAAACFGVAGAVVDGRSTATNLPWTMDETTLAGVLSVKRVRLLNDLEATAHGVLELPPDRLAVLQEGRAQPGNYAVIAAGTGLGEALIIRDGGGVTVVPSEGGHADFAPGSDLEIELLRHLRASVGPHVSWERVLSGPGLLNIYRFLRHHRRAPEPAELTARMAREDPSAVVSQVALAGRDPVAVEALDLFVSLYGAEAGNLALKALAVSGVFVAGGIAPKILPRLTAGGFVTSFRTKGRFDHLMTTIPVRAVLEPRSALLGAARVAAGLAADASGRPILGRPVVDVRDLRRRSFRRSQARGPG